MRVHTQAQCDGDGCERLARVVFNVANDGFGTLDADSVPRSWRWDGTTLLCRECCGGGDRVLTAAEGLTPGAITVDAPDAPRPKKARKK